MAVSFDVPPLCKCQAAILSIMEEMGLWRCRGSILRWQKGERRGGIVSDDAVRAAPQEVLCCKTITTLKSDLIST